ncbi:MAG: P-II family nitrogen regulator [Candidatus Methanosuratincola sp.]
MKLVIAYIKPEKLEDVKMELNSREVFRMSVTKAKGCGETKGYVESYRGVKKDVYLLPKLRLEIAVNDDFVDTVVEGIIKAARTGKIGDGKIFILPLEECIRIRTGERGPDAVGGWSRYSSKHAPNREGWKAEVQKTEAGGSQ